MSLTLKVEVTEEKIQEIIQVSDKVVIMPNNVIGDRNIRDEVGHYTKTKEVA